MEPPPVHYVTTPDGKRIACTDSGAGRPLVFLPLSLNHVQLSWRNEWRLKDWLRELSARFRLVRYDSRGQGMSSRGLGPKHSIEHYCTDLGTVVDHLRLSRFVLLGYSWFSHVAIRYAAAHPERVEAIILVSPAVSGKEWSGDLSIKVAAYSWDLYLRNFVPDGLPSEEADKAVRYLRQTITLEDFLVHAGIISSSDVSDLLPSLRLPVLVLHPPGYLWTMTDEVERLVALVPGAKLALIDGNMALGDCQQGIRAIDAFLDEIGSFSPTASHAADPQLTRREREVLSLLAQGCTNQQIADRLVISVNTAARHVASILAKTGSRNRTEAALLAGRGRSAVAD